MYREHRDLVESERFNLTKKHLSPKLSPEISPEKFEGEKFLGGSGSPERHNRAATVVLLLRR